MYEFSNYSQYTYTEFDEATGDTNTIYPYDDAKFDARVVFSLEGGKVREVIAKLAPIDTAINRLELGEIRRTRLSQVAAAIWLTEENRATIICFRSVEKYLRDLLLISCKKGSEVGVW